MTTLGRMSPADVRAKKRALELRYSLESAFPADHRAHVHAYYAYKGAVNAAICAAGVRAEFDVILAGLRAKRLARDAEWEAFKAANK